jgi:uncharacterized protein
VKIGIIFPSSPRINVTYHPSHPYNLNKVLKEKYKLNMHNIWLAFITGLTTGGVSCFAIQGGLLASAISGEKTQEIKSNLKEHTQAVGIFLGAKLLAYVLLGLILGAIGSALILTPRVLGLMQVFAGLYMLATAARLANLHPIFRYTVINPPRWAYTLLKKTSLSQSFFAPFILGFLTILMPCGITQAMMVYAVASGNPWVGAEIMGAFVLGTSPVFFILGEAVAGLLTNKLFTYVAATLVAVMGIISINGGLVIRGSIYTLGNFYKAAFSSANQISDNNANAVVNEKGEQTVHLTVTNSGYSADVNTLKANVPVRLKITSRDVSSCARAFVIPEFNISKVLPANGEDEIVFTPTKTGRLTYSCSMGMYTGEFIVVN